MRMSRNRLIALMLGVLLMFGATGCVGSGGGLGIGIDVRVETCSWCGRTDRWHDYGCPSYGVGPWPGRPWPWDCPTHHRNCHSGCPNYHRHH